MAFGMAQGILGATWMPQRLSNHSRVLALVAAALVSIPGEEN